MSRVVWVGGMYLALIAVGCGGQANADGNAGGNVGGAAGGSTGGNQQPAPTPGDDDYVEGDAYDSGPYHCCPSGEDTTTCCVDYPPEPSGSNLCFQYGGVTADSNYPEGCAPQAPPSLFICVNCGDHICGPGENPCACPGDCPAAEQ